MAQINGRGGWDITDEEAAEVLRLSEERDREVWLRMQAATYPKTGLPCRKVAASTTIHEENSVIPARRIKVF